MTPFEFYLSIYCGFTELVSENKSSAVAEMGDCGHNRHGPKRGGLLCPFAIGYDVLKDKGRSQDFISTEAGLNLGPGAERLVRGEGRSPLKLKALQ